MALAATTVFEVQTGGSDTNGGGFVSDSVGTDYSQQAAAEIAVADGVTDGTVAVSSATANFPADCVGSIVYIEGGTGSIVGAWYEVMVRNSATVINVDRVTGLTTGTGVTLNLGGALASPGGLGAVLAAHGVAGMKAYMKSGTYAYTSATSNISGGKLDLYAAIPNQLFTLKGYETDRDDYYPDHARPFVNGDGQAAAIMIKMGGGTSGPHTVENIEVDGANHASVNGIAGICAYYNFAYKCKASQCDGTTVFASLRAVRCVASDCNANGFLSCMIDRCWADSCGYGFLISNIYHATNCIASNNSSDGFNGSDSMAMGCSSFGNTGDGFSAGAGNPCVFDNCISYGNTGKGYNNAALLSLINCAAGSNSGGYTNVTPLLDIDPITLTADPFTNAAGGDFSLNNTAGGGALCRAAGISPVGQTGFPDIGAVQHEDVPYINSRRNTLIGR